MIKFLFWNLNRKPLQQRIANLVHKHDIDLVALVEYEVSDDSILEALNTEEPDSYRGSFSLVDSMAVFSRFRARELKTVYDDPATRLSIRHLTLPSGEDVLLALTHCQSKLHCSDASQSLACEQLAHEVRKWEERLNHSRTLLVGDLNMNPFEAGVVASHGLHATMARQVAQRETRTVQGRDYPFFYNPMWAYFGDVVDGPPGTYYNSRAEPVCYFWNIFDQVLVRPALLEAFQIDALKVLDTDGTDSLLTRSGLPDRTAASDHLPIVFALDL